MRLNRPQGAARHGATTGAVRGRLGAGAIRVFAVTAVAAAACGLWAGAASAATSHVKHHTSTTVSASPNPVYVHSAVTFTAKVRGWVPKGTVQFYFGTRKLCHATLSDLKAHCKYGGFADAAVKTITAKYLGNATHAASSGTTKLTVRNKPVTTKSATTTTITNTGDGTVDSGDAFTFDVTVSGTDPTGAVAVTAIEPTGLSSAYSCSFTLTAASDGAGQCTIHPPAYGIVEYEATYAGDATHSGSTSAMYSLAVQNVTTTTVVETSATAGDITLSANVNAGGANISEAAGGTGTVTFYEGTSATDLEPVTDCGAQPLSSFDATTGNNSATCTGNAELNGLAAGTTVYVSAVYSGDPVNVTSTSPTITLDPTG